VSTGSPASEHVSAISRDEVVAGLRSGQITLVDVLSPESFASRHIPGAINLPVADIARRAPELLPDRRARIVTYCGGPT
jgi:rhodanese-related sulfurtransferase